MRGAASFVYKELSRRRASGVQGKRLARDSTALTRVEGYLAAAQAMPPAPQYSPKKNADAALHLIVY